MEAFLFSSPQTTLLFYIFAFGIGLCFGSFANVMGLRLLKDEDFIKPPSHCTKCDYKLTWKDNIPVISYILLGGQCRQCKEGISIQYPLIEMATGLLFVSMVWFFGAGWQTLLLWFLAFNLVVIFITDLLESYIFPINSLTLVPAGLIYSAFNMGNISGSHLIDLGVLKFYMPESLASALLAILVPIVFFEGMILFSKLVFGTEGFGHGDTHLMMGVGVFIGWKLTIFAIILGFVIQLIPSVPILVFQWIKHKQWPSLISGTTAAVFAGLPYFLKSPDIPLNIQTLLMLGCMVISLIATFIFLRVMKTTESYTYLPLGPALIIGSLAMLFWGQGLITKIGWI